VSTPIPPETLAWLHQKAAAGVAEPMVLRHVMDRLDALEASGHLATQALASMRRASANYHVRLLSLEASQQQPADHLRDATEMVTASESAPEATMTPHGYAYRYPGPLGGIEFTNGQAINGSRPIEAIPYWLGVPPAAEPAQVVTPFWKSNEEARRDRAGEAGKAAADASFEAVLAAQPTPPITPAEGLVERVVAATWEAEELAGEEYERAAIARVAIRHVAAWLDREGYNRAASDLRDEVAE